MTPFLMKQRHTIPQEPQTKIWTMMTHVLQGSRTQSCTWFSVLYEAEVYSFRICKYYIAILIGIALNLQIDFDRMAIFTRLILLWSMILKDLFVFWYLFDFFLHCLKLSCKCFIYVVRATFKIPIITLGYCKNWFGWFLS